jgi:putative spermidine/putrescine transport system permease protein
VSAVAAAGLERRVRGAAAAARMRALLLVLPLLGFVVFAFLVPLGEMLFRSVDNTAPCQVVPETCAGLERWDGTGLPGEAVYAGFARELAAGFRARTIDRVGMQLNYEATGMLSLVRSTARRAGGIESGPYQAALVAINAAWGEHNTWATMKHALVPYTLNNFLHAVDHRKDAEGAIVWEPEEQRIYLTIFARTFAIGLAATVLCLLLGYPVAHLLAHLSPRWSSRLLMLVLLPFWTSLLVRTTAWIVLLQSNGVVLDLLVALGLVADDARPALVYNQVGTMIAMTHVLLPFMILPLYSVMRTVSPVHRRAALSLGAHPVTAFLRVYLPLTLPGVGAGCLLVFILSVGYYITPALVGGQSGQLISNLIAYHMRSSLNWGLASALGTVLLAAVVLLYWLYNRLVGVENARLA